MVIQPTGKSNARQLRLIEMERQLSMPYSVACRRLRKILLLDLVRRLGLDRCCICGETIATEGELSIDHKQPWLHVSAELFWDLDHIAFAHFSCNSAKTRTSGKLGIPCPPGQSWCKACKRFLPIAAFHRSKSKKNGNNATGCRWECKRCGADYLRAWRKAKKEKAEGPCDPSARSIASACGLAFSKNNVRRKATRDQENR